ncbi:MAG: hypothetical protein Q9182_005213 [Xanthomendoza sp. 2 TL-2023]
MSLLWPTECLYTSSNSHISPSATNADSRFHDPIFITTKTHGDHSAYNNIGCQSERHSIYPGRDTYYADYASNLPINHPEHLGRRQSFSEAANDIDWDDLSGTTDVQTVGFSAYGNGSQPPFANIAGDHSTDDLLTSQGQGSLTDGDAIDDDADLGSLISAPASTDSTADGGNTTNQTEDSSATLNISDSPEEPHWTLLYPPPESTHPSPRDATLDQFDGSTLSPDLTNLHESSSHTPYPPHPTHATYPPYPDPTNTLESIWHPHPQTRSPTPENPLDFFAQLSHHPCADILPEKDLSTTPLYPPTHLTNPPRTKLTSLPPLLPATEPFAPRTAAAAAAVANTPTTISPPLIVPASTQYIFTATARVIEKVNAIVTTKRRNRQFGMPPPRKCFGLRLPPSREFVRPTSAAKKRQQKQKQQQRRRRGLQAGRRRVGGGGEGFVEEDARAGRVEGGVDGGDDEGE